MYEPDPRSGLYPPPGGQPNLPEGKVIRNPVPGRTLTGVALTLACVGSIFFFAALAGLGFAYKAKSKGDPWANAAIVACYVGTAVGIGLAVMAGSVEL